MGNVLKLVLAAMGLGGNDLIADPETEGVKKLTFPSMRTLDSVYYPSRDDFRDVSEKRPKPIPTHHAKSYHDHYALTREELNLMRQLRETLTKDTDRSMSQRMMGWLKDFDHTLKTDLPANLNDPIAFSGYTVF